MKRAARHTGRSFAIATAVRAIIRSTANGAELTPDHAALHLRKHTRMSEAMAMRAAPDICAALRPIVSYIRETAAEYLESGETLRPREAARLAAREYEVEPTAHWTDVEVGDCAVRLVEEGGGLPPVVLMSYTVQHNAEGDATT